MMTSSLVVSLVFWGRNPPTHRICSVFVSPNFQSIVTGCRDGQLCVWDFIDSTITPKSMLFGHTSAITSITSISTSNFECKGHIISASDNGEICAWDLLDGRCLEQVRLPGSPIHIQGCEIMFENEMQHCIMCYGQFSEITILSASSFNVLLTLASRIFPDWIACAKIFSSSAAEPLSVLGLTVSGMFKVWKIWKSSSQPVLFEEESKQISCPTPIDLQFSKLNACMLLIICPTLWLVCDSSDYSVLCSVASFQHQQWLGGGFLSPDQVVVWTRNGEVYLYKLPFSEKDQERFRSSLQSHTGFTPQLEQQFNIICDQQFLPPATLLHYNLKNEKVYLFMGTCNGTLSAAQLSNCKALQIISSSLKEWWERLDERPIGIIDQLSHGEPINITASLFVVQYCYLCCGREDGTIVIVSAAKACKSHLLLDDLSNRKGWPPHKTLRGHKDRVTCLLYPCQEAPERYSPQMLVSGSSDFSVVVWDIILGTLLYSFNVHGGELTQLMIPPDGCNPRVSQSVCSVACDHSVALLSLRDRKCVLLASRHPSPVTTIRWRPDDDYLVISCADSTVFVWQMETGHLDRFEQGKVAADIINACDEMENVRKNIVAQNSVNLSQALKTRSLSAFKAVAQQGLKSLIEGLDVEKQNIEVDEQVASNAYRAMIISPLRANPVHDADSHVVFINTEALIAKLLMEHSLKNKIRKKYAEKRSNLSPGLNVKNQMLSSLIKQVKSQFLDEESDSSMPDIPFEQRRNKKDIAPLDVDSAIDIAQIIVSCVHAWNLDDKLDSLCLDRLGMLAPRAPVSFGLLSPHGHMSLQLPASQSYTNDKFNRGHWKISGSMTTQHLVSIISIANTMMELPHACFKSRQVRRLQHDTTDSEEVQQDHLVLLDQSQVKQGWSLLATLHVVLLPEGMERSGFKPPKLEMLARRWQDRCLELRDAAQALMLAELRQMGPEGRRQVVETWLRHVPDYVYQPIADAEPSDSAVSHTDEASDRSSVASDDLITPNLTPSSSNRLSYEVRRRHAVAIVILGVIGAEFGQELDSGFTPDGLSDRSLAHHTCKALVYLLLQPPSSKLPAHIPIRRAAVDLIGRGFTVWEPYMEVSAVLLGLLELCETYNKHIGVIQSGMPLAPDADSCRSAHHSLTLIATARPLTFITTIAREVARHNAAAANPQHQALLATSVLVRAKPEVLRIIEHLADKMMSDMNTVLVEVVDIVLFCIDVSVLRTSYGLLEAVPSLAKFHTISYDARSRRVAVAGGQGAIVLYDTRTCKHQVIPRGRSLITALCFSPDGKYLCVYSASENQLSFWITATSLFGMLQSQVKCVKTLSLLKMQPNPEEFVLFKSSQSKLVWVNNRSVVLLSPDGSERRFHI